MLSLSAAVSHNAVSYIAPSKSISREAFEMSNGRARKIGVIGIGNNTVMVESRCRREVAGEVRIGSVVAAPFFDVRNLAERYGFPVYRLGNDEYNRPLWFVSHCRSGMEISDGRGLYPEK